MNTSPVHHVLGIYRIRLKMIENGTTHPKPEVADGVKRLVAALSEMQPNDLIYSEVENGKACFKMASTGNLIVEFPWIPN